MDVKEAADLPPMNTDRLHTVSGDLRQNRAALLRLGPDVSASLTLLETALSAVGAGFAYVDREFRFVHANQWVASAIGTSVEELVNHLVESVVWEEFLE